MRLDKFLKVSRLIKVEVLDIKDTTKKEEAGDLFKYL